MRAHGLAAGPNLAGGYEIVRFSQLGDGVRDARGGLGKPTTLREPGELAVGGSHER